jgi:hypothetical protein
VQQGLALSWLLISNTGCGDPASATPLQASAQVSPTTSVFETDGIIGRKERVLVTPMIESDTSVWLRARQAGVDPSSLRASVYGLQAFSITTDAEIGTAFAHRKSAYHLGGKNDQLIVDEQYFYCDGFVSSDLLRVKQKSWSTYYSVDANAISLLDTLAEAVRSGSGHEDAYKAIGPMGDLLRSGSEPQTEFERSVTWFAGRSEIEDVIITLSRSKELGNFVHVEFAE